MNTIASIFQTVKRIGTILRGTISKASYLYIMIFVSSNMELPFIMVTFYMKWNFLIRDRR